MFVPITDPSEWGGRSNCVEEEMEVLLQPEWTPMDVIDMAGEPAPLNCFMPSQYSVSDWV